MTTENILQLFGCVYILFAFAFIFNSKYYAKALNDILSSKASLFFGWLTAFILWFIMLLFFNDFWYTKDWLVAIIWVISLIKWILLLLFPKYSANFSKMILKKNYIKFLWLMILLLWVLILYYVFKV